MPIYSGQNGRVFTSADPFEGSFDFPTILHSVGLVFRWVVDANRGPANVTPKAHAQNISIPSAVDWRAELWGVANRDSASAPMEWFNTIAMTMTLDSTTGVGIRGFGYTEFLVHEVPVNGPVTWRARVRMQSALVFI